MGSGFKLLLCHLLIVGPWINYPNSVSFFLTFLEHRGKNHSITGLVGRWGKNSRAGYVSWVEVREPTCLPHCHLNFGSYLPATVKEGMEGAIQDSPGPEEVAVPGQRQLQKAQLCGAS